MKKGVYIILCFLTLISCSQDITFNNVAVFQGVKDNQGWKADDSKATMSLNALITIEAVTLNETMTLRMPMPSAFVYQKNLNTHITYVLNSPTQKATYSILTNDIDAEYETGNTGAAGEVVITDFDGATISGTFRFNASNTENPSTDPPIVNLQSGVFYKVPIVQ